MAKAKALEDMSLDQLRELEAALADERHELRLRQKAVQEAIAISEALQGLSPEVQARVIAAGVVSPEGGAK